MAKRYSIAEARAKLSTLIDEVANGAEVELTRRGEPVAWVISRMSYEQMHARGKGFGERYRRWLERYPREEIGDFDDVFKDLRDPSPGRDVDFDR